MLSKKTITAIGILVSLPLIYFAGRQTVAEKLFERLATRVEKRYGVNVTKAALGFTSPDAITILHLCAEKNGDTIIHIAKTAIDLSLIHLVTGNIRLDELSIQNADVLYQYDLWKAIPSSDTNRRSTPAKNTPAASFKERITAMQHKLSILAGTDLCLEGVKFTYRDSLGSQTFSGHMYYHAPALNAVMYLPESRDSLLINGVIEKNAQQTSLQIKQTGNSFIRYSKNKELPAVQLKDIVVNISAEAGREWKGKIQWEAHNLSMDYWRLSAEPVTLPVTRGQLHLSATDTYWQLDSSSRVVLQNMEMNVFARNEKKDTVNTYTLQLHMPATPAEDFFSSLPQGLFHNLKGIQASGSLAYDLFFQLNSAQPDSLLFRSSLTSKNFRIVKFGEENFARINESFDYTVFENGQPVRVIRVGTENPSFTPLQRISPYLTAAVLQAEDPSFFEHRGFLPEAFRESIAKNYKEKRFARGGSTISMQLVKNLFLSRNKTVGRKVEEALIVYLIENLRLVPKERMLEIYLNVIEWGPGVYGIGEAAGFYFRKPPHALTLQESIFLSALIPKPKYFKYQFTAEGNLRPHLADYFQLLAKRMVVRGRISAADTIGLTPEIKLTGPAAQMVAPVMNEVITDVKPEWDDNE